MARFLVRRGRGKARGGPRRPYAHRKPRGYEAQAPGDLVQVDTLMVSLGPGEVVRHFSAVDLFTRYALGEVHSRATAGLAGEFLSLLVAQAPFPIRAVQVDGGSEFMAEFGVRLGQGAPKRRLADVWGLPFLCCLPGAPSSTGT